VLKTKPLNWFGIIVGFTALTLLVTYLLPVPSDSQFSVILIPRYFFSFAFIAFLPGYCLVNLLFLGKNRLDFVEEKVLSVALSFGLDGLVGLFLGLSPIGITFTSITVSLSILVLVLAAVALVRKLREPNVHSPEQVSS
jgi:uncharacterized membrane protein